MPLIQRKKPPSPPPEDLPDDDDDPQKKSHHHKKSNGGADKAKWSCVDSCCWFIGCVCVTWWFLLFLYNAMPASFPQYVTEAITGPLPDPPGVKLKKEGLKAMHPVVFIPGIVTGGLELWEGKQCADGLFRKRLWGGTFGEVYKRPLCWVEHMSLDNETGLDPAGIRTRAVSGLVAADYFAPGYFVWAVLIANLAHIGYEEKNMYMAAYDWRLSFQNTEVRDQTLSRMKSNIELMVSTNGGKKAVIVPHSMGVLYFLHFMKWVEAPAPMGGGGGPDWCAKHIKAVMNIGGPFLGVPKAVAGLFSAEAKDVAVARAIAPGFLDTDIFRLQTLQHVMRMTRTWDSTMSMIPKGGDTIWGGLDWSPEQGYTCSGKKQKSNETRGEEGESLVTKTKPVNYGRIISFGKDVAEAHPSEIKNIDFRGAVKKKMYTEEKKKDKNYGSIFAYCVLCFVLIVEVARFAKPYYGNLQNLMETEALVVEEGFVDVMNSGKLPCPFKTSRSASARSHEKLSGLIRREDRARPPSSYCVKFQNFATMAKLVKDNGDKYESRPFSVGGYNWTLLIYPNENKPVGSGGYVSMYVRIDNSSLIANPHDVYAEITFLTYKSTIDRYHFLQETDAQRFHLFKQQYGQLNFLEIGYYKDPGHGFIFDGGQSVFGVDILVANPFEKWEVFSYEENIRDPLFNWKLTKFSTCNLDSYTSGSFSSGGRDWVLKVYPNGVGHATGNSLSLFLLSASNEKGYVKAKLRVIDQIRSNHLEKQVDGWPNATENGWGFEKFISFADLKDSTKGFLADDAIKFEVEILSFSKTDTL